MTRKAVTSYLSHVFSKTYTKIFCHTFSICLRYKKTRVLLYVCIISFYKHFEAARIFSVQEKRDHIRSHFSTSHIKRLFVLSYILSRYLFSGKIWNHQRFLSYLKKEFYVILLGFMKFFKKFSLIIFLLHCKQQV